jgi:hypothetical protein
MLELTVNAKGLDAGDLEQALEETLRLVRGGFTSGFDSNDTGRYSFEITGAGAIVNWVYHPELGEDVGVEAEIVTKLLGAGIVTNRDNSYGRYTLAEGREWAELVTFLRLEVESE